MALRTEGTSRKRFERFRKDKWALLTLEISVELSCGLKCVESCIGGPCLYQGSPERHCGSAEADIVR